MSYYKQSFCCPSGSFEPFWQCIKPVTHCWKAKINVKQISQLQKDKTNIMKLAAIFSSCSFVHLMNNLCMLIHIYINQCHYVIVCLLVCMNACVSTFVGRFHPRTHVSGPQPSQLKYLVSKLDLVPTNQPLKHPPAGYNARAILLV